MIIEELEESKGLYPLIKKVLTPKNFHFGDFKTVKIRPKMFGGCIYTADFKLAYLQIGAFFLYFEREQEVRFATEYLSVGYLYLEDISLIKRNLKILKENKDILKKIIVDYYKEHGIEVTV